MIPAHETDYQALEELLIGDPDFEKLETAIAEFNIFEALGAVRPELRHSDFLAFLLNPEESHGLGDAFLTRMLQRAVQGAPPSALPVSPVQLDLWDLGGATVLREWQNIDLLIADPEHEFVVVVENKIGSTEHSRQLERYFATVERHYPGWSILALYLTPEGDPPTGDTRYVACSYDVVHATCEEMLERRGSIMGADVQVLLRHYSQMLRRHILSDTPIAELCREIYRKHRRALDLIFEHRPDRQDVLRHFLLELVAEQEPALVLDHSTKAYIRFAAAEWDDPRLQQGRGWTESGRMLLYELENYDDYVRVKLVIGPGPDDIREVLYRMAEREKVFSLRGKLTGKWKTIYSKTLVPRRTGAELDLDDFRAKLKEEWERFLAYDFVAINQTITSEVRSLLV